MGSYSIQPFPSADACSGPLPLGSEGFQFGLVTEHSGRPQTQYASVQDLNFLVGYRFVRFDSFGIELNFHQVDFGFYRTGVVHKRSGHCSCFGGFAGCKRLNYSSSRRSLFVHAGSCRRKCLSSHSSV